MAFGRAARGTEHFVYSKMQCWVALERGLRITRHRGLPLGDNAIRGVSAEIYEAIMQQVWCEKRQSFAQYVGSAAIDANALLLPLMLFVSPADPRVRPHWRGCSRNWSRMAWFFDVK